jgi:hypothetical protein
MGGASGSSAMDAGPDDAGGSGGTGGQGGDPADGGPEAGAGGATPDAASPGAHECIDAACGGTDLCCIRATRVCGGACSYPLTAMVASTCSSEAACADGLRRTCLTHADCASGDVCCASGEVLAAPITESLTSRSGDQKCQAECAAGEAPIACMTAADCPNGQLCCRTTGFESLESERLIETFCAVECAPPGAQQVCASEADCRSCRPSLLIPGLRYCAFF